MSEKQPQLNNEILARLGDEHAQAQLDVAEFIESRPETSEDILHVPTPADMVADAVEDYTDKYVEKSFGTLIEDLNTSRNKHKEKVQVVDKNGKVVYRYKMMNPDPTKTDDLFDALATKLAQTELTEDGTLTVLNQMNKKLSLSDEEISTVIDKVHFAKEDIQNQADVETNKMNEIEEVNPFNSVPDLSTRKVVQKDIDDANNKLVEATVKGDEKAFSEAEDFLHNEVVASELVTGVKGLDAFNKETTKQRAKLQTKERVATGQGDAESTPVNQANEVVNSTEVSKTEADSSDKEISKGFVAPNAKEVMVRTYLNAEGKPIADIIEFTSILNQRVANGDDSDWDELTSAFADTAEFYAASKGMEINPYMEKFNKYIAAKRKELESAHDRKLPVLYEGNGTEQIPVIVPATTDVEKKRSWKKRLAGLGLAVLAAAGIAVGANYIDDNYIDKDKSGATSDNGNTGDNNGGPSADEIRGSGALGGENGSGNDGANEGEPTAEELEAIDKAVAQRTGEISDVQGSYSWARAETLYGDQAAPRLMSAVEALQADGVDAQWHGDPNTDSNAWISIDGNSDTNYVWNRLAQVLGAQDVAGYLSSLEQNSLPETE